MNKTLDLTSMTQQLLPDQPHYERSLMHKDIVNFVFATITDFLITTSIDGHVKFWKKTSTGIDFVKHYKAHLGVIVAIAVSFDGRYFATAGGDKGLKIFDILTFDMINMIKTEFLPLALCWTFQKDSPMSLICVSDKDSSKIQFYDGRGSDQILFTVNSVHSVPVHLISYNPIDNVIVSMDTGGMVEYWVPRSDSEQGLQVERGILGWEYKSDTDLYEFKKKKTVPISLVFSPNFQLYATFGFDDYIVRIFNYKTAKIWKTFEESPNIATELQHNGTSVVQLENMEFGRRLALEREISKAKGGQSFTSNLVFDESGQFLIYPTFLGIKIMNIFEDKLHRFIGESESLRFLNISLYQGAPKKKAVVTLEMATSDNSVYKDSEATDPTLYCTAYKKNRFYCFSRRSPEDSDESSHRDIFNEKPTREESSAIAATAAEAPGNNVTLNTTFGDIHISLFPEYAPKAVENFIGLAKKGYFDRCSWHRIMKGFMIQSGDPNGDGSGGESLWGFDFEDEFHPALRHDRPYTLSMANMGANTNASQFFITCVPTPWLDNKHTIFGRCTGGFDVVHRIEAAEVNKHFRPVNPVRIDSLEFK